MSGSNVSSVATGSQHRGLAAAATAAAAAAGTGDRDGLETVSVRTAEVRWKVSPPPSASPNLS